MTMVQTLVSHVSYRPHWDIGRCGEMMTLANSLVLRLLGGGGEKEPGTHRLRMRLINCHETACIGVGVDE